MPHSKSIPAIAWMALVLTIAFTLPFTQPAQAQISPNHDSNDSCITCHENLYFLHDTGNWYCLRESPMTCTECHGGNPNALTLEKAHAGRAAHPVINEDISKCQECHPEQCDDRMEIFNQAAGINEVLVAVPYTAVDLAEGPASLPAQDRREANPWINYWEIVPIALVAGAALVVYAVFRARHPRQR